MKKKNKGITLIALVITIIVMLILVGVTITISLGPNGLIKNAQDASLKTKIAKVEEEIQQAMIASYKSANGLDKNILLQELEKIQDIEKPIESYDTSVIARYYGMAKEIDVVTGETIEVGDLTKVEDEYPGDITDNNKHDGTVNNPYLISSVEDLVAFSNAVNNGNSYANQYVALINTLDIKSSLSYANSASLVVGGLKTSLTTGQGFTPIGSSASTPFAGTFETKIKINDTDMGTEMSTGLSTANVDTRIESDIGGEVSGLSVKEKAIKNLYINCKQQYAGLIGYNTGNISINLIDCNIKNLQDNGITGGIAGTNSGGLLNCSVTGKIEGMGITGGIAGQTVSFIVQCYNYATVNSLSMGNYSLAGGIVGEGFIPMSMLKSRVEECANFGVVTSNYKAGGIAAESSSSLTRYCYNQGEITGGIAAGGIAGDINGDILNCYNSGKININNKLSNYQGQDNVSFYIGGIAGINYGNIKNCYNVGEYSANVNNNISEGMQKPATILYAGGIIGSNEQVFTRALVSLEINNSHNSVTTVSRENIDTIYNGAIAGNYKYKIINCNFVPPPNTRGTNVVGIGEATIENCLELEKNEMPKILDIVNTDVLEETFIEGENGLPNLLNKNYVFAQGGYGPAGDGGLEML